MQVARTFGPPSTLWRATLTASSYLPSLISCANLGEPATLVRSPIMMKTPACWVNGWDPERRSGFAFVGTAELVWFDSLTPDSQSRSADRTVPRWAASPTFAEAGLRALSRSPRYALEYFHSSRRRC